MYISFYKSGISRGGKGTILECLHTFIMLSKRCVNIKYVHARSQWAENHVETFRVFCLRITESYDFGRCAQRQSNKTECL